MANYVSPINQIYFTNNCFRNSNSITSVDLHYIPWVNNAMYYAFDRCDNLKSVSNINKNVTNMYATFLSCHNFTNAPVIPNNVTNLSQTFGSCRAMAEAPVIPNSVTNMYYAFCDCSNLKTIHNIPPSVVNMERAFAETYGKLINIPSIIDVPVCNNLSHAFTYFGGTSINIVANSAERMDGMLRDSNYNLTYVNIIAPICTNVSNIFKNCNKITNVYISSENITDASLAFQGTSLTKNVYIPFYYSNNEYTQTYNAFISAGYKTDGSLCGVYLKDINTI